MSDADEQFKQPTGDPGTGGIQGEDAAAFRAAANFIREGAGADSSSGSHEDRQRAEQQQIIRWVQGGNGRLFSDADLARLRVLSDSTSEHWVLVSPDGTRVIKVTWPGFYGQVPVWSEGTLKRVNACPSDYLDRQALQDEVFESDLILAGVNISDKTSMVIGEPSGQPSFVVSQTLIAAVDDLNPTPTAQQIAEFMTQFGFEPIAGSYFGWLRREDRVAVVDARPDNFIFSSKGVVPIDLQIARVPQEALAAMKSSP